MWIVKKVILLKYFFTSENLHNEQEKKNPMNWFIHEHLIILNDCIIIWWRYFHDFPLSVMLLILMWNVFAICFIAILILWKLQKKKTQIFLHVHGAKFQISNEIQVYMETDTFDFSRKDGRFQRAKYRILFWHRSDTVALDFEIIFSRLWSVFRFPSFFSARQWNKTFCFPIEIECNGCNPH